MDSVICARPFRPWREQYARESCLLVCPPYSPLRSYVYTHGGKNRERAKAAAATVPTKRCFLFMVTMPPQCPAWPGPSGFLARCAKIFGYSVSIQTSKPKGVAVGLSVRHFE